MIIVDTGGLPVSLMMKRTTSTTRPSVQAKESMMLAPSEEEGIIMSGSTAAGESSPDQNKTRGIGFLSDQQKNKMVIEATSGPAASLMKRASTNPALEVAANLLVVSSVPVKEMMTRLKTSSEIWRRRSLKGRTLMQCTVLVRVLHWRLKGIRGKLA